MAVVHSIPERFVHLPERAGGLAGATYRILTATNAALPLVQWTPIVTNQFGASGGFSYTNVVQPNLRAQFFRAILP